MMEWMLLDFFIDVLGNVFYVPDDVLSPKLQSPIEYSYSPNDFHVPTL
jgi:hypothetical protein